MLKGWLNVVSAMTGKVSPAIGRVAFLYLKAEFHFT